MKKLPPHDACTRWFRRKRSYSQRTASLIQPKSSYVLSIVLPLNGNTELEWAPVPDVELRRSRMSSTLLGKVHFTIRPWLQRHLYIRLSEPVGVIQKLMVIFRLLQASRPNNMANRNHAKHHLGSTGSANQSIASSSFLCETCMFITAMMYDYCGTLLLAHVLHSVDFHWYASRITRRLATCKVNATFDEKVACQ